MQKFKQGLELFGLQLRNTAAGFLGIFSHANTADRTYTLPDKTGTFAMLTDITGTGFTRVAVSDANYTIVAATSTILAYSTITAARTLTLPPANIAGQLIWVISESGTVASNGFALTIARAGTDTIEGNTSYTLLGQYNSVCLSSNGTGAWAVITYKYPTIVISDAAYTVAIREDLQVVYNTLTAARIITLPSANTAGQQIVVMDASGSCSTTLTLTITRAGSDTVNGLTTFVLNGPYAYAILTSNGSGKWICSTTNNGTNPAVTRVTASAVPFLTSTRTDLSASVTFIQSAANEVNCSGIFGTPQITIVGAGAANVAGSLYFNSGYGLTFQGKTGTSYDFAIANPSQTVVLGLTTATNNFVFIGGASFAATITSSANIVLAALTAGTSAKYIELSNTGNAGFYFGVESSVAGSGFTGSNAYESVLYSANNLFVNTSLLRCGGAISALSATFKPTSGPAALHVTDSTGTAGRAVFLDGGLAATYNWVVAANYNITNAFEITASTTLGGSSYIIPCFKLDASGNGTLTGSLTSAGATISQTATLTASSGTAGLIIAPGNNTLAQIMLYGSLNGASGQNGRIYFNDTGNNSLDIRANYAGSTVTLSPGGNIAATLSQASGLVMNTLPITATTGTFSSATSSIMVVANNINGGSGNVEMGFQSAGAYKYTIGHNITIGSSAAFEIYDTVNSKSIAQFYSGSGNAAFPGTCTAVSFPTSSDLRLKKNIRPIENPYGILSKINGIYFDWIDGSPREQVGVIAQDVQAVLPHVIYGKDDFLTVDYSKLTAVLIEGYKLQQKQIETLQKQIEELMNR